MAGYIFEVLGLAEAAWLFDFKKGKAEILYAPTSWEILLSSIAEI